MHVFIFLLKWLSVFFCDWITKHPTYINMRNFLLDMQTKQDLLLQQKSFATFCCNHLNSFSLVFLFFLKFLLKQTRLMRYYLFLCSNVIEWLQKRLQRHLSILSNTIFKFFLWYDFGSWMTDLKHKKNKIIDDSRARNLMSSTKYQVSYMISHFTCQSIWSLLEVCW